MKTLVQILAPLLAALLGYVAAGAFHSSEEKVRVAPTATPAPEVATASTTLRGEPAVDAIASILTALSGTPSLADFAATKEALDALTSAQMGDLLQRTLTMRLRSGASEGERAERVALFMRLWTARDPEAATEWMRPRLARYARQPGFSSGYRDAETRLVESWARSAPQVALEIARSYPRSELGYQLLWTTILASRDMDDARRFELMRDFPAGSARDRIIRQVCESWARSDFPAALAALGTLPPDAKRNEIVGNMLAASVGRDPAATLASAESLGMADDPKTVRLLAMAVGDKAPWVTARWLEARGAEALRRAGAALVFSWAQKEPATAFSWAQKHGIDIGASVFAGADGDTRSWAMRRGLDQDSPIAMGLAKKPEVVLGWLRKQPAGTARDTAVIATLRAMRDPQQMIPLMAMLPPEAAPQGAEAIAARFVGMGSDLGVDWARTLPAGPTRTAGWTALGKARGATIPPKLPPGPDRDAWLRGSTQAPHYVQGFPEKAMERALAIGDTTLRRQTFDEVMSAWAANPKKRESAGPWLDSAAVPEAWKTSWRAKLQSPAGGL
jgi:hypothetical protein